MNVPVQPTYEAPNICPHCHVVMNPDFLEMATGAHETDFIIIWRCTSNTCGKLIAIEYKLLHGIRTYKISRVLSGSPTPPQWPKPIQELRSGENAEKQSRFIKIYEQSLQAEHNGLDEIAGMGFRKAIEHLVKDWAIQIVPDDAEKIKTLWLGQVIEKYYNGELKSILVSATYLGNDQAHYIKLFEEYDVQALKELIDLIAVELDREFKKKHYTETIKNKKH